MQKCNGHVFFFSFRTINETCLVCMYFIFNLRKFLNIVNFYWRLSLIFYMCVMTEYHERPWLGQYSVDKFKVALKPPKKSSRAMKIFTLCISSLIKIAVKM